MKIGKMKNDFKIAIIGSGMTAVCAAALATKRGYQTLLVSDRKLTPTDKRTTAILMPGLELLAKYAIKLDNIGTPLKSMYISDRSAKYFPQNDLCFEASEIELAMFGRNIANNDILTFFINILQNSKNAKVIEETKVKNIKIHKDFCQLVLHNDDIVSADLILAADGHNSLCREQAGIRVFSRNSAYRALVFECNHQHHHEYRSSEIFLTDSTLTTIPLEGNKSSIIWIVKKNAILDFDGLKSALESLLGAVEFDIGSHQSFDMSSKLAHKFYLSNLVLVGDSAHKSLPFAAQGFNLCLGDIDFILSRIDEIDDISELDLSKLVHSYQLNRYPIALRTLIGAELLKNGFFSPIFSPVGLARNCFIKLVNNSDSARVFMMKTCLHNSYR